MTLFNNKYRIESARLKGYDYSFPGEYFVTICTGGMIHPVRYIKLQNHRRIKKTISQGKYFSDVVDGEIKRNDVGEIVAEEWQRTQEIRKNVVLDEWVIMPNHFHDIVCIVESSLVETTRRVVSNKTRQSKPSQSETSQRDVSTRKLKPNSLGSIIGQFKSITAKRIRTLGCEDFSWQPRFYDHIIRDEKGLNVIRDYIRNNPTQWEYDRNDPSGLYNWKPNDQRLQRKHIN